MIAPIIITITANLIGVIADIKNDKNRAVNKTLKKWWHIQSCALYRTLFIRNLRKLECLNVVHGACREYHHHQNYIIVFVK